jgi:glycerol-3-phosphate dehydrogenase
VLHGAPEAVALNAEQNGVPVSVRADGALEVPGEAVTDPVAYTHALVGASERLGATLRTGFRVAALTARGSGFDVESHGGERVSVRVVVNSAGLRADEVARLAGDHSFEIYPRKGEFLVFDPPGAPLREILLPVPTKRTKGVLVFPTLDGKVVAGPTAVDGTDKDDWSVRPEARGEIMPKAVAMFPPLDGAEPVAEYAGLRPAGRGVNYVIGPSAARPGLINVAAIRSTGLSASLGIAEHVAGLVEEQGVALGPEQPLAPAEPPRLDRPWGQRAAARR